MKTLALLFALSLVILPNPIHCIRNNNNPIRLPTAAHVALASDAPVLDTDGMELQAGGVYSIHNVGTLRGVRLVGSSNDDTECPSDVIFSRNSSGDPIIFTPADPSATKVLESALLNLKFNISVLPQCEDNGFWEVQYDVELEQQIVKTGDVVRSLFKIERTSSPDVDPAFYGISYCPFDVCYGLSVYYDRPNDALHFALSNTSFPVVFQKVTPPVLDTDGDELLARGVYNIISVDEPEGEVGLVKLDNTTECPSDVILKNDNSGEDRIMFTPPGFPNPLVRESTYLSIKFSPLDPTPLCQNNASWEIQYDSISGQQIVKTGDIVRQLFKIERLPSPSETPLYKITYCPTTTLCYNVSTYKDPSVNALRLDLSNDSFVAFVFKKATSVIAL